MPLESHRNHTDGIVAIVFYRAAPQRRRFFWTAFVIVGTIQLGTSESGIPWLDIEPDQLITQAWISPIRDWLHPRVDSMGFSAGGNERRYFLPIATQINSLRLAYLAACFCSWLSGRWAEHPQEAAVLTNGGR